MVFSKRRASKRHLFFLIYILVVVLLFSLWVHERQGDESLFSLSDISSVKRNGSVTLSCYGEAFHSGVRGVLAKSLVNEEALLWQLLAGVPSKAIDVKNNLALAGTYSNKLVSLGLQDGKGPEFLGSIDLPDSIREIKIVGDQAIVGMTRHAGFSLVDLKDPRALKLVRNIPGTGLVQEMVVDGSILYYTDFYQGVGRIDLSVGDSVPELLVSLDSPWRISLQNNRLVVGTVKGGVHLFDIAQDGKLIESWSLDYQVNVRGVAFVGDSLAITLADSTLHLLDLSSWPKVSATAKIKLSGSPLLLQRVPDQASISVGMVAGGIELVDVSRQTLPVTSGELRLPKTFSGMKVQSGKIFGVSKEGIEAFSLDKILGGDYSLMASEATIEPESYNLQSWNGHVYGYRNNRIIDFGKYSSMDIHSSSRYMPVVKKHGVSFFEQLESGQIQRASSSMPLAGTRDAHVRGRYLYALSQEGLQILSGDNSEELVVIGSLALTGKPKSFEFLDSGYLLVATRDNGMLVVDVHDPQQPTQVANMPSPLHLRSINIVHDILVDGQRAYVSQGAGGVYVFDMSSPTQPELLQIIGVPGQAKNMVLYDNLLLVSVGTKGLFIIDIKDRNGALAVGTLPTPLRIDHMAVVNDGLIVSSHPGGTMKLPLPRRMETLRIISKGEMRADVEMIEKGEYAFFYDDRTSVQAKVGSQ